MKRIAMIGAMTMAASVMMAGKPSEDLGSDYDPVSGDKTIPDHAAYTYLSSIRAARRHQKTIEENLVQRMKRAELRLWRVIRCP